MILIKDKICNMGITKRSIIFRTLSTLLIVLFTVVLSLSAYSTLFRSEEEHCWEALGNAAHSIRQEIVIRLTDNAGILQLAAGAITNDHSLGTPENILDHVNGYVDMTIFSRIDVIYPDNTILFQNGLITGGNGIVDFDRIISSGEHISERTTDFYSGKEVLFFNVPIMNGSEPVAILVGVIDCDRLSDYFHPTVYGGEASCILVDRNDVSIIMNTLYGVYENIYDFQEIKGLDKYENEDLILDIREGREGVIAYNSPRTGENNYMYYTPVETSSWQLLVVVQERLAFEHLGPLSSSITLVVAAVLAVIIISAILNIVSIAQMSRSKESAERQLHKSNVLIECVTELSSYSDIDLAINNLLAIINRYFGGDRTYIFDVNHESQTTNNLYEYASEGVTKEINNLQNVPLSAVSAWLDEFSRSGIFYISDIDRDVCRDTNTYDILAAQGISSLIAVPLLRGDTIIGYMGVDNPQQNYQDLTLLSSVQFFVTEAIERKATHDALTRMSFTDTLTHLHNRNKFNYVCDELLRHPRSRVGVAFFDLDGLKQTNDQHGHDAGDRLIVSAADNIRSLFSGNSYRIGGDEFAVIVPDIAQKDFDIQVDKVRRLMAKNDISIAIGISWHEECPGIKVQLKEADERMYVEKAEHRRLRAQQ